MILTLSAHIAYARLSSFSPGDLKGKNVLISSQYRAKVTDFGLSAKKQDSAFGTPYWYVLLFS